MISENEKGRLEAEQAGAESQPAEQPTMVGGYKPGDRVSRYMSFRKVDIGVKPGYILRKVGKAHMVMPTGPRMKEYEGMITLNETGAFLFKESQKPEPTKEKLIEACKREYGATDEEALKAVDAFVIQCADCGLFESETKYYDLLEQKEVTVDEIEE